MKTVSLELEEMDFCSAELYRGFYTLVLRNVVLTVNFGFQGAN